MRTSLSLLLAFSSLLAASSIACGGAPDSGTNDTSRLGGEVPVLPVIQARTWAQCWTEPSTDKVATSLFCQTSDEAAYPYALDELKIEDQSSAFGQSLSIVSQGKSKSAAPVKIGEFTSDQFPVKLNISATPSTENALNTGAFDMAWVIDATSTFTQAAPFLVKQPFDLWPVLIVTRPRNDNDNFFLSTNEYTTPIAPFLSAANPFDATNLDMPQQTLGSGPGDAFSHAQDLNVVRTYVVAPASGGVPLEGRLNFNPTTLVAEWDQTLTITGPSVYVADGNGLRLATGDDDIQLPMNFPAPVVEAADAGAATNDGGAANVADAGDAGDAAVDGDAGDAGSPTP